MIVSHLMRLRTIAGLGALLTVVILAGVMIAGPAAAHCEGVSHHHCDGGDTRGSEPAIFDVVLLGDIDSNGSFTATQDIGKNQSQISFGNSGAGEIIDLDMAGFVGINATSSGWNLDRCFAGSGFKFTGSTMQVVADKNDPDTGSAGFWFTAKGADRTTDVKYHLRVTRVTIDPPDGAIWP